MVDRHRRRNPEVERLRNVGIRERLTQCASNGVTFQIWKVADLAGFRQISCISAGLLVLQIAAGTCALF